MRKLLKKFYSDCRHLFQTYAIKEHEFETNDFDEAIDTIYAIREGIKYLEDTRKALEKRSREYQRLVCMVLLQKHRKSWKTHYCTATTRVTQSFPIPKKSTNPDDFYKLMKGLGIPDDLIDYEVIRIHWPGFTDYVSEILSKGGQVPEGIHQPDATTHWNVTIRGRESIDD